MHNYGACTLPQDGHTWGEVALIDHDMLLTVKPGVQSGDNCLGVEWRIVKRLAEVSSLVATSGERSLVPAFSMPPRYKLEKTRKSYPLWHTSGSQKFYPQWHIA